MKRNASDRKQDHAYAEHLLRRLGIEPVTARERAHQYAETMAQRAKRQRKREESIDSLVEELEAPPNHAVETADMIEHALSLLTDKEREAVEDVFLLGRRVRDAAVVMGITEAAVRKRIARSRLKFPIQD